MERDLAAIAAEEQRLVQFKVVLTKRRFSAFGDSVMLINRHTMTCND